ncbi:MAG: hypothetical protein Q4B67_06600 [Eubacteriales bacterium]|nr:hypothetical protein [Eubacteriales bacterium]
MRKITTKKRICLLLALVLTVLTAMTSLGAVRTGTGTKANDNKATTQETGKTDGPKSTSDTGAGPGTVDMGGYRKYVGGDGRTYYEFDGKKFVVDYDWGQHYLTGYVGHGLMTRSGKLGTTGYTASSTYANLGKYILVEAESATRGCTNISRYDGIYKCEDTGGPAVETGIDRTMNSPVVDLCFGSDAEADYVTDQGWITARVYILKEVN